MMSKSEKNQKSRKQPMKYWFVELTLTCGEVLKFYVKALNQHFAYEKADQYAKLTQNIKLRSKMRKFQLLQ